MAAMCLSGQIAPARMRFSPASSTWPKPLAERRTTTPRNAAVPHQKVGADADHGQRHVFRQELEESDEIVRIMWLEHQLGEAARLEPCDAIHRRVRRQTTAQLINTRPERDQQLFSIHLFHSRLSRKRFQFARQCCRPLGDVTCSQQNHEITRLCNARRQSARVGRMTPDSAHRDDRRRGCAPPRLPH